MLYRLSQLVFRGFTGEFVQCFRLFEQEWVVERLDFKFTIAQKLCSSDFGSTSVLKLL